mgnify:CR=1 FL=1
MHFVKAETKILFGSDLKPLSRLILVGLKFWDRGQGRGCFASKETMSNMTSMIASLEAAGATLANTFGPPLNMVAGVLETMAIGLEGAMNLLYAIVLLALYSIVIPITIIIIII